MKNKWPNWALSAVVVCAWPVLSVLAGSAGGQGFSYQGQLKQDGVPYNGSADMLFSLRDVISHALLETTVSKTDVSVVNGLFTVTLDFGNGVSIFDGRDWELDISVRVPHDPTNTAPFTPLVPGQLITTAPYATTARSALQTRGIFVDAAGHVGIGPGPFAPEANLQIGIDPSTNGTFGGTNLQIGDTFAAQLILGRPGADLIQIISSIFGNSLNMVGGGGLALGTGPNLQGALTRLFISSSGNVGIGTTTPAHPLHVVSDVEQTLVIENTGSATNAFGVLAKTASSNGGVALRGEATAATGFVQGVVGLGTNSPNGRGVFGRGNLDGVLGQSLTVDGVGVRGSSGFDSVSGVGVSGSSTGTSGTGVFGEATAATGSTHGVHGKVSSPSGYAGFFEGRGYFSDDVGIGTTTPDNTLHVQKASAGTITGNANAPLVVENSSNTYVNLLSPDASESGILFGKPTGGNAAGGIIYDNATTPDGLQFRTNGSTTRMAIDGLGNVGIGTAGHSIDARLHVQSDNARVAKFDRYTTDGQLVAWARDDGVVGDVSVSAGVVSYNAFTGSHYAWSGSSMPSGMLVSMTGENHRFSDREGAEVMYGVLETARANDPACLGVCMGPEESDKAPGPENPLLVAAVGNGEMWVVDAGGGDINPGDYLISSDVAGHAMKDDPARFPIGHIVARAAERVKWKKDEANSPGVRRAKISVLFGNFVRGTDNTKLLERIAHLEAAIKGPAVAHQEAGE